jgi:multidrug transporter EmrE-like cation transporter
MSFSNPYFLLFVNVFLVSAAQLLLKRGAAAGDGWTGLASLGSPWTIGGIACYLVGFLVWLRALQRLPLHVAFPLTSGAHILIPLGSWLLLGESVPLLRWGGILLVTGGIALCSVPR